MQRKRRNMLLGLISVMFLILFIPDTKAADRVKESGILTAIESDGSIVIEGVGYYVDSSVVILDAVGKTTKLSEYELPISVNFEYVYQQKGPVIKLIKVLPKMMPQ